MIRRLYFCHNLVVVWVWFLSTIRKYIVCMSPQKQEWIWKGVSTTFCSDLSQVDLIATTFRWNHWEAEGPEQKEEGSKFRHGHVWRRLWPPYGRSKLCWLFLTRVERWIWLLSEVTVHLSLRTTTFSPNAVRGGGWYSNSSRWVESLIECSSGPRNRGPRDVNKDVVEVHFKSHPKVCPTRYCLQYSKTPTEIQTAPTKRINFGLVSKTVKVVISSREVGRCLIESKM